MGIYNRFKPVEMYETGAMRTVTRLPMASVCNCRLAMFVAATRAERIRLIALKPVSTRIAKAKMY